MGCGVSTLDAEDGSRRWHSNFLRRHKTVRPVTDNNMASEKLTDNGNDGSSSDESEDLKPLGAQQLSTKQVGFECEKTIEKWLERVEGERVIQNGEKDFVGVKVATEKEQGNNGEFEKIEEDEADTNDRKDAFTGPGSLSFREYCIDNDSGNPSFRECSNEYDSGACTLNEGEDDSTKRQNQPQKEEVCISNKELEKNERKGRRFRSVPKKRKSSEKRKSSGKRNFFPCYTSSGHTSFF